MSTIYPELGTGKVVRNRRGGVETITMIKEAASKGCLATVVEDLINAPESRNPMMALFEQINSVDVVALSAADRALLTGKIEEAVEKGDFLRKVLTAARERLENSKSVAAHSIPLGF